jgi:hypothetical protein
MAVSHIVHLFFASSRKLVIFAIVKQWQLLEQDATPAGLHEQIKHLNYGKIFYNTYD